MVSIIMFQIKPKAYKRTYYEDWNRKKIETEGERELAWGRESKLKNEEQQKKIHIN